MSPGSAACGGGVSVLDEVHVIDDDPDGQAAGRCDPGSGLTPRGQKQRRAARLPTDTCMTFLNVQTHNQRTIHRRQSH